MKNNEDNNNRNWKKVLYEKLPYPDNYIDSTKFLDQLDIERSLKDHTYKELFLSTSVIAQQVTVVSIFLSIYKYIVLANGSTKVLFNIGVIDLILLIIGYLIDRILSIEDNNKITKKMNIIELLKSSLLFIICLRIVAPILQTLTSSFSDDTINALAITFATLHLVFYDYGFVIGEYESFSGTISLNAAVFTAVLLASRLSNIQTVVVFVLLAIICFSLFPMIARIIKRCSMSLHLILTFTLMTISSLLLWFLDKTLFTVYEIIILFLWIICPLWFMQHLQFKNGYKGPWDIAPL
jgi:phosphatidylinositol glycan class C protein